jgi:hypothetical protein
VLARSKKVRAEIYITRLTAPAIDWGQSQPRLQQFQAGAGLRIGEALSLPVGPVKSRLSRAREALRRALEPRLGGVGP